MTGEFIEVPRGLNNVVVAETTISDVHGEKGFYQYRDHSAIDLARTATFEDVWFLLFYGQLPTEDAAEGFRSRIRTLQSTPEVTSVLSRLRTPGPEPLRALQSTLPQLASALQARPLYDLDEESRVSDAMQFVSAAPSVLASAYRAQKGLEPLPILNDRGIVANYLYRVTGELY